MNGHLCSQSTSTSSIQKGVLREIIIHVGESIMGKECFVAREQGHKTENALLKGPPWPARKPAFPFMCEGSNGERKKERKETEILQARHHARGFDKHDFVKILKPSLRGRNYYSPHFIDEKQAWRIWAECPSVRGKAVRMVMLGQVPACVPPTSVPQTTLGQLFLQSQKLMPHLHLQAALTQ